MRWRIQLGDSGDLPRLPGEEGVLRVSCSDTVVFSLPVGSLPTLCGDPILLVRDELGVKSEIKGSSDGTDDWCAEWRPERPGPFGLSVSYSTEEGHMEGSTCRIVVDPSLSINDRPLPARSIVQLTVLSRCAGPVEKWPETLAAQGRLGYNMLHFTPVQTPGESGSCYAIDDQNQIDPSLMELPSQSQEERLSALKTSVARLEKESGLLSAVDIVLNHTAGSSPWLLDHPESAYSVGNCSHLAAAGELDERLNWFMEELRLGRYGGAQMSNEIDVERVVHGVEDHVIRYLKLAEFFSVDKDACVRERTASTATFQHEDFEAIKDSALPSIGAVRRGVHVQGDAARRFCSDGRWNVFLDWLDIDLSRVWEEVCVDILQSVRGALTCNHVEPQVPRYFRRLKLSTEVAAVYGKESELVAHNGWVADWPATEDFAAPTWRFVYLRRRLNVWSDCVKLRYGDVPTDAPFLWDHMTRYAQSMASVFHAIRLDNAHSTPLHVSQHMLAQVRKVNHQCWVFAELFTGNLQTDLLYQQTLGINALIREAMQSHHPRELSYHLGSTLWGAHPLGALSNIPTLDRVPGYTEDDCRSRARSASFAYIGTRELPLRPRHCPALVFDCTHDNQTPAQKRHARDALPNAALVAACSSSIGSVRGYDELVPANPSVFDTRTYQTLDDISTPVLAPPGKFNVCWPHGGEDVDVQGSWDGWREPRKLVRQSDGRWTGTIDVGEASSVEFKFIIDGSWTHDDQQATVTDPSGNVNNVHRPGRPDVSSNTWRGILSVKQALNALHVKLGDEGFVEVGVQHLAEDIIAVQRREPDSGRTVWFVVRTAFWKGPICDDIPSDTSILSIPGRVAHVHVAATLFVDSNHERAFRKDDKFIRGLDCYLQLHDSVEGMAQVQSAGDMQILKFSHFPPGSVLVFSADDLHVQRHDEVLRHLASEKVSPILKLPLAALSYLLFSCNAEELDRTGGHRGAYDVPGYGPLVYCGLMGVCAVLDIARRSATGLLNHPIVNNVRDGDWLVDYLIHRLGDFPDLVRVHVWLMGAKALVVQFPRFLTAFYFDLVISTLCSAAAHEICRFGPVVSPTSFRGELILATAQFWGATESAPLHWDRAQEEGWRRHPSLSAGLPHFATGFMRNWGRDTFISLRGCLLVTQRWEEARSTILVFASVLRHGLVPNLLDSANNPRYNARDATWFFLHAVQQYVKMAPEGVKLLSEPIKLKWPVSTWDMKLENLEPSTLADVIHLIFSAHAHGICFREWNAGPKIDEHMVDEGFNVSVYLDEATGVIYGGNGFNCGTWMDKNGSSIKASNKGVPATPRDGAAVEIIGLLKSALQWVTSLSHTVFPYELVKTRSNAIVEYKQWNQLLERNFEKLFWVDSVAPPRRSHIYKDTVGATRQSQDWQLRPNFCIAMSVAPEMFNAEHAKEALVTVAKTLVGPLGMRTLDPMDPEFRGDYHNDDDSSDQSVAHGWNYHQGPEWVWPFGFYLQAWCRFGDVRIPYVMRRLLRHRAELEGEWRSLPELTNSNGGLCRHSCPAQAWSIAVMLDALESIREP